MASSSNIFASNVFYSGNVFGPSGEQLTQAAALTQKIQDLAGGFSNGAPGIITSTSVVGAGVVQSTLSPFGQGLEGSIYFPGTSSNYITTGGAGSPITAVNWATVSGGFTLELWANFPSFTNASTDATSFPVMIGNINNPGMGGPAYYWGFGPTTSGVLYFSYYNGSSIQVTSSTTLSTNTWYHLCVQSNGTNIFQFVNGTLASTTAISGTVTVGTGNPLTLGASYSKNPGPTFYLASARLTYGANLYSQGSFTVPTTPLGIAPTGQTVMLLRNPLYSAMTLKNPLNVQSSVRVRCLPSDALIYVDAFGSNVPNKGGSGYSPPSFDPYGTGAVLYRASTLNSSNFGTHYISVSSKGFTVMFKIQLALGQNNNEQIFNISATSYIVFVRNGTTNQFNVAYSANGSSQTTVGTITINQDVTAVVAVRYDPRTTLWTVWLNGAIGASGTASANQPSDFNSVQMTIGYNMNMNLYTFAVYNRALTDNEITDATAMLSQVAPVVPSTVEIGNVNGRPALTVDPTGAVNVLGPLNGAPGGYAPVDLGINSLSLASGNLTSNISVTSFSPLGSSEGSLYFPGVANTYISFGATGQPFSNSNIYAFGDFVVEAWVNPVSLASQQYVVYQGDAPGNAHWLLYYNTNGTVTWYSVINSVLSYALTTTSISAGTWTHLAVIHQSSTKRLQIYFNGQPQPFSGGTNGGFTMSGTIASYTTGIPPTTTFQTFIGGAAPITGSLTNLRITTGPGAAQIYNNNAFTPSTSPLFPASNTAGGSLTTRLLVRVPRAPGQVQTQKLIGAAATGFSGVQAFPPAPMTGYATNMTGLTPYGQGTYVASASVEYDGNLVAWKVFDKSSSTQWSSSVQYNGSSPYNYSGSVRTVDVNGNSYSGEWVQIQMPSSIVLSSYSILEAGDPQKGPGSWFILGSRDGSNWSLVDQRSSIAYSTSLLNFSVTSSQAFIYFRIVISNATGTGTLVEFREWTLNGTIEGLALTQDGRLGVGVSAPVQALEVAGSAVVAGTLSAGNPLMFRNRIINGDMRIWQRGTSFTASANTYTADRWVTPTNSVTTITATQSTNVPFRAGFQYSLSLATATTANNPLIEYRIEQFGVADLYQGTPITISFWMRQTVGSSIPMNIEPLFPATINAFGTGLADACTPLVQQIIPSSNWQYYTLTFCIAVTGVATNGLSVQFWQQPSANPSTVLITGVQLEKGSVATPFEVVPYGTQLALCQRYYQKYGGTTAYERFGMGIWVTTNNAYITKPFITPMRAAPTLVTTGSLRAYSNNLAYTAVSSVSIDQSTTQGTNLSVNIAGTAFVAWPASLEASGDATATLQFSAEL